MFSDGFQGDPIPELERRLLTQARKNEQLRRQVVQLTALHRLSQEVMRHLTIRQVITAAHEQIRSILSPDWGVSYLRRGDWLIQQDPGQITYPAKIESPSEIKVGQCLCGLVVETGQPVYSADIRCDDRCTLNACKSSGITSFAGFPLFIGSRIGGVLGIASLGKRDFSELGPFLRAIAQWVGKGLYNAEIHEQTQQHADVLKEMVRQQARRESKLENEVSFRNAIIENAAEGLCVCSETGLPPHLHFSVWNDRMTEITGYGIEEINRLGWYHMISKTPERQNSLVDSIKGAFLGEKCCVDELEIVRPDGQRRIVSASSSLMKPMDGTLHVLTIVQDITARVVTMEALLKARKLEAASVFAGGIAHDFNNLLTVVLGSITLAKQEAGVMVPAGKFLSQAEKACMQAKALTSKLIAFATGGMPVKRFGSIEELLRDTVRLSLAGTSLIEEVRVSDALWEIEFDAEQLKHALANVLANAVEASDEGGRIHVWAENTLITSPDALRGTSLAPGKFVTILIRDYGRGISKENMARVFDPYFSTKEKGARKGMGLGLTATYSIVRNHGGHITMESKIGVGTAVKLYFPAREKSAINKPVRYHLKRGMQKKNILMMEDEKTLSELAGDMLTCLGYNAVLVENGREAIEKYKASLRDGRPYDAVILDLTIRGGIGARETLSQLKKMDPGICAIVSSGHVMAPEITDFSRYGFKAAVVKPYTLNQLDEVLTQVFAET
jgi:PAS domain S-box-containing protein